MKSKSEEKIRSSQFAVRDSECSACGTAVGRDYAKFCRVCGKLLLEDYQPLDALRASYRLQGKSFQFAAPEKSERPETENLFEENKNAASATATALIVYSLVPYLGILFCPFALLTGGFGILTAYRQPSLGGGKTSAYSIVLSVIIFAAQVFLWWLFYIIPEVGK
ncbi:MAG: hypothetical protein LH614_05155 [Pyrinomonadaceae bacterium]|nr:hypothetical protein [Pyrinomonadaceae bacterium]